MKKMFVIFIVLVILLLAGCNEWKQSYMESLEKYPNDGEIEFNDVRLTIPVGYSRDTTMDGTKEGYARRWEQGNYSKIVTITKHEYSEQNEEGVEIVRRNQEAFAKGEVDVKLIDFFGEKAIESSVPVEDGELKYLMFNAGDHTYHYKLYLLKIFHSSWHMLLSVLYLL